MKIKIHMISQGNEPLMLYVNNKKVSYDNNTWSILEVIARNKGSTIKVTYDVSSTYFEAEFSEGKKSFIDGLLVPDDSPLLIDLFGDLNEKD